MPGEIRTAIVLKELIPLPPAYITIEIYKKQ